MNTVTTTPMSLLTASTVAASLDQEALRAVQSDLRRRFPQTGGGYLDSVRYLPDEEDGPQRPRIVP